MLKFVSASDVMSKEVSVKYKGECFNLLGSIPPFGLVCGPFQALEPDRGDTRKYGRNSVVPPRLKHSQSDVNASIPAEAAAPQKEKEKGKMKKEKSTRKTKTVCKCLKTLSFWMRWMLLEYIRRKQTLRVSQERRDPEWPTRRSCRSTKSQWYAINAQCVAYKGIVAQERFRNSSGKTEEYRENDAHKIYQGLNDNNDFKHRETYKILAREPRWANLRDYGLNDAVNIPRNVARRTSDNSSPGNSVGSNNLSEDPDDPPIPQSEGPNFDLYGSLYEGESMLIGQKLYKKNLVAQKVMDGVAASGSGIQTMLDELRLEKRQTKEKKRKEEEQKQCNTGKPKWISSKQRRSQNHGERLEYSFWTSIAILYAREN
ncbi:hypothetical protein GIB67_033804 [Kingdonia uniflora]|uniref:No apical meristem-associated C-terminal domain-containing protein n=1 Tax=Kingdonia uniflora TaxID=39325 RepID=A0A7J7LIA3_9MAGN|nr:hypothetical protein GIB67_033804 [Kingdonia uniflora]